MLKQMGKKILAILRSKILHIIWRIAENNNELSLCGLVEDKEIAARAVAFVVNSTRKGIVPLCADVANLLRSKQR